LATLWSQTGSLGGIFAEAAVPNVAAPASAKDAASPKVFLLSFLNILILPRFAEDPRAIRSNDRPGTATICLRPAPHDND
jgi:hypothetical protein